MKNLLALLLLPCLVALPSTRVPAAAPFPPESLIGGFAVGCQAYSFNRFSVFEAIEKTDQAGGRFIEFYPGQRLTKDDPTLRWDHNSPPEVIARVKEQLAKHNVRAVNYGVVNIPPDETEARKIFEFARKLGLYAITTEAEKSLDVIEKLVQEFDIRVGFHEHARRMKKGPDGQQVEDTTYRIWDPVYLRDLLKGRDVRIGACADTGHWASSGLKPVECLKILEGRLISLHLKERAAIGQRGPDIIYGTGVTDIKGALDELRRQKFAGHISIEYENNWDFSVPDIAQCIGFIRGYAASFR